MRSSPVALTGALCFDRAGTRLLVVEPQAISVVRRPAVDRHARRSARAHRLRRSRARRPIALPFAGRGQLAPAPCGSAAAVWPSATPIALIDDFGTVVPSDLGDLEIALPLTGRRYVGVRGSRVTLLSGSSHMAERHVCRARATRQPRKSPTWAYMQPAPSLLLLLSIVVTRSQT
jgi:hypothetical protein